MLHSFFPNLVPRDFLRREEDFPAHPLLSGEKPWEQGWNFPMRKVTASFYISSSGGGPLISVGIFRSKCAVPFLTNRFFALIREFGTDKKWQELFLLVGAV